MDILPECGEHSQRITPIREYSDRNCSTSDLLAHSLYGVGGSQSPSVPWRQFQDGNIQIHNHIHKGMIMI